MPDLWAIVFVVVLIAFAIGYTINWHKSGGDESWDIKDREG